MRIVAVVVLMLVSAWSHGQKIITGFTLPDATGNSVSLDSYSSASAVVIIFRGNECAFDNYYTSRIQDLVQSYSGKVQFLLINSYVEPAENAERMAARSKSWGLDIPYLADKAQVVMDVLGAKRSPEAFLLAPAAGKFTIVYQGALDDNPQVASDVKQRYLRQSIDNVLAGRRVDPSLIRATGCSIRKK